MGVACCPAGRPVRLAKVLDVVSSVNVGLGVERCTPGLRDTVAGLVGFSVSAPPTRASPFEAVNVLSAFGVCFKSMLPSLPPSPSPFSRSADTLSASRYLPLQESIASRHLKHGLLRTRKVSEANRMPSPTRTIAPKEVARVLACGC